MIIQWLFHAESKCKSQFFAKFGPPLAPWQVCALLSPHSAPWHFSVLHPASLAPSVQDQSPPGHIYNTKETLNSKFFNVNPCWTNRFWGTLKPRWQRTQSVFFFMQNRLVYIGRIMNITTFRKNSNNLRIYLILICWLNRKTSFKLSNFKEQIILWILTFNRALISFIDGKK